jgi:UDP-glucose 4-epimerase
MPRDESGAVLITGASGFLGTYIADAFASHRNPLLGIDRNAPRDGSQWKRFLFGPCETASIESLLTEFDVTTVFHLAGGASVPASVLSPFGDFAKSVPGTMRLLAEVIRHRPQAHVIFMSSAAVYGNPTSLPVAEDAAIAPVSPYGIHKAMSEFVLQQYARLYGLRVSVLRVFSAFGPGLRKQLFWDLGRNARETLARGERAIVLQGTGHESRDFIFASDVAKAALHIAHSTGGAGFDVFNIGSGCETEIRDAASQLIAQLDLDIDLVFDGEARPGVPHHWCADVTKLRTCGFSPEVSFGQGISRLAGWLKKTIEE